MAGKRRNTIFARRVQDWFLRQKFEITVKIYRAERPDDGPRRQRSENGNVLCMSPQHVEVTRRQLRQLQKGALSSWTTVFHEILIREFESGVPVEFVMVDKERVLNVEPIDLRTSPAFGSGGRVDSEYIRFSTLRRNQRKWTLYDYPPSVRKFTYPAKFRYGPNLVTCQKVSIPVCHLDEP